MLKGGQRIRVSTARLELDQHTLTSRPVSPLSPRHVRPQRHVFRTVRHREVCTLWPRSTMTTGRHTDPCPGDERDGCVSPRSIRHPAGAPAAAMPHPVPRSRSSRVRTTGVLLFSAIKSPHILPQPRQRQETGHHPEGEASPSHTGSDREGFLRFPSLPGQRSACLTGRDALGLWVSPPDGVSPHFASGSCVSAQRRCLCSAARVYQTSDADNSQNGNVWFQPRRSCLTLPRASPLPGPQGTTPPRAPPHCSGRLGQVGRRRLPGALEPEGGRGCLPWSPCCLSQAPELSPGRDKAAPGEACSARRSTKPTRHRGNPHTRGLVKLSGKRMFPHTPLPGGGP